jgi:heparin/heparan-sulfate lyase
MDSRDAVVEMRAGEYFFGNHQHKDFGTFQIYYRGALAISSGYHDVYGADHWSNYYHPTISHNGLLVFDPAEQGEVSDGGQRWPKGGDHPRDVETLLSPDYRMARILAHQFGPEAHTPEYSYLAGDITGAYSQKARLVTRSMVTFRLPDRTYPATLVVFDRVHSARPEFRKTWLLHSIQEPQISGRTVQVVRDQDGYGGKLFVESLLPDEAEIRKIGGPGKEFWVENLGRNFPLTMKPRAGAEPGGWRIEVSSAVPADTERFLHVMTVADATTGSAPVVHTIAAESMIGAQALDRAVLFGIAGDDLARTRLVVPPGSRKKYLVCDLRPGVWVVQGPGKASRRMVVSAEAKCLYLDLQPGHYLLTLTKQR